MIPEAERLPPPPVDGTEGPNLNLAVAASGLGDILPGGQLSNEASAAQIIDSSARQLLEAGKLVPQLAPALITALRELKRALEDLSGPATARGGGPEEMFFEDRVTRNVNRAGAPGPPPPREGRRF
jgi:hypothetical protein